jgi:hypothetical protein
LMLAGSANRFTMSKPPPSSVDELGRLRNVSVDERKEDETVFMTPDRSMGPAADESKSLSPLASKRSVPPSTNDQVCLNVNMQEDESHTDVYLSPYLLHRLSKVSFLYLRLLHLPLLPLYSYKIKNHPSVLSSTIFSALSPIFSRIAQTRKHS